MDLVTWLKCGAVVCTAWLTSWLVTGFSVRWLSRRNIVGIPNQRSLHSVPTPCGGGVGIIAGIIAAQCLCVLLGLPLPSIWILAGLAMVALIGLVDDVRGGIPILIRLCAQLGAAGLVVWGTGGLTHLPLPAPLRVELGLAAVPLTMFWIVGVTNVYNFLDGIDGYAATQGVIVGITFACLAPVGPIGLVGFAICGGCLGFLPYNWHPAKVFMGDVGSLSLGFLAASLPLQATGTFQADCVFATALALWFFLADGTFTLTRRLIRGERIWDAHRSHLYQRLVLANRRHDQVVRMMAMGATILAALAIAAIRQGSNLLQWSALALAIALMLAFHQVTLMAERSNSETVGSPDGSHDGNPEVSRSN